MSAEDLSTRRPPDAAILLVPGVVMHARLKPMSHRFDYRVFNLLVDIDRLTEADECSPLFRVGRFALAGFNPTDHGAADGPGLRAMIERFLAEAGESGHADRILLWCYPRILGHVFDPLSIFFVYSGERLTALIYAVRNTFGERHTYVAPIRPGELGPEGVKQSRNKLFYVSPFMDMSMRYHFRISPPGETLRVRILETDVDGPILSATFSGRTARLTTGSLLAAVVRAPLLGLKVVGGIHWEAAKLWFKGARYHTRPPAPDLVSFGGPGRT